MNRKYKISHKYNFELIDSSDDDIDFKINNNESDNISDKSCASSLITSDNDDNDNTTDYKSIDDIMKNFDNKDNNKDDNKDDNKDMDNNYKIIMIEREKITAKDSRISDFINFCIKHHLFDNTFYDYGNAFSIVATKLPVVFRKLSNDGKNIKKDAFIKIYKNHYKFKGDLEFIYDCIDEKSKGYITWDELLDFFLPFIKYTTF